MNVKFLRHLNNKFSGYKMPAMNPQLQTVLQQAIQAFQDGNFNGADLILQDVLQNNINSADYIKSKELIKIRIFFSVIPSLLTL